MNDTGVSAFASKLMQAETTDSQLRHQYEQKKLALTERQLNPLQRCLGWLAIPMYAGLIIGVVYRMMTDGHSEPREWLWLPGLSAAILLALGLWTLRVLLRQGRVRQQDDRLMELIGGVGLCLFSLALFEMAQSLEDVRVGVRLYVCAAVLLASGVISILFERARRWHLETEVRLMEVQLQVNKLSQAIQQATIPRA